MIASSSVRVRLGIKTTRGARIACWLIVGMLLLAGGACGSADGDTSSDAELAAVTSLELFADIVRQVGGERVEVRALLPSGADPHTYELSPGQVADVVRADVVFINGLGLEGNLAEIVEENAGGDVVVLTEGLEANGGNPHLWLDARRAVGYVETIREAFVALDADGAAVYEANAAAYIESLKALDGQMLAAIDAIAPENRKLVTFHDAFPYLAERYGLEVVAVVVSSPGKEPSARDVAELVETLQAGGVPAAFKEPQFSADVLDRAAEDAGVRVLDLLSDAYTDGVASYLELMRFNIEQLQEGLGAG